MMVTLVGRIAVRSLPHAGDFASIMHLLGPISRLVLHRAAHAYRKRRLEEVES
jgi:hypothetical protein